MLVFRGAGARVDFSTTQSPLSTSLLLLPLRILALAQTSGATAPRVFSGTDSNES